MEDSFKSALFPYIEKINYALNSVLHPSMPALLHDPIEYFLRLPGKRIRPLLTLIVGENFGCSIEKTMPAAIAIEILHDFTLIHDDIMDEDSYRRGFQTVHTKWDISTAILAGDAMVSMAYQSLLKCESPHLIRMMKEFTDGMYVVCAGQALDKEFESRDNVALDDYLEMIDEKTARLISLSMQLGYLAAVENIRYFEQVTEIGRHIGLAFQIQDDLLDYIGNQNELGKDIGSDWRQRKKSFIAIAYRQLIDQDNPKRDLFAFDSFEDALKELHHSGIITYTREQIANYLQKAKQLSDNIGLNHPVFMQLIDFLEKRNY